MEQIATALLPAVMAAVVAMFWLAAGVALIRARQGGPAGRWAAVAFASLAVALLAVWVENGLGRQLPMWLAVTRVLLIFAFPYLLLRFTTQFRALPRWIEVAAASAAAAVGVATVVLLPALRAMDARPWWGQIYFAAVMVYWVAVSAVTIVALWRAGHGQPSVPRRRMRLMSVATGVLALAVLIAVELGNASSVLQLIAQLTAGASAAIFALGLHPPRPLRLSWRHHETERLQAATIAMLGATTAQEVARHLLPATAGIVGASGAAVVDADGRIVARHGDAPAVGQTDGRIQAPADMSGAEVVAIGDGIRQLVVWTSPYTPFFAREEVDLLHTMAAVATVALERAERAAAEQAQHAAIEQARQEAVAAHDEADRANRAKSEFVSRMSHELRTPLNAILGFGQLLETSSLDEDDREAVDHIMKAGRHLLALINDVLDLSRVEAGTMTISLEPVDALELINDTVSLIQPLADSRDITVTVADGACEAYVMTDRQRCRQVLLNLLSNAVKYNRDGGDVTVTCEPIDDTTLRVAVHDTGPGIDPSRRDQLFEPFERLGAETSGIEGTGLGLALTKQLVERLGGTIGVDSHPGAGSRFWINLPVTEPPAPAEDTPTPAATRKQVGGRTLLLVEDNLANLRLVEAMLRRRPHVSVLPAMQGRLAIDLAHQHQPDVIVLDLHLPDLPGREVLHRLRADTTTQNIPVIIASADATPRRVAQLRQDGAFAYLTKPLDLHDFLDAIDAAIEQRDAASERGLHPEERND